MPILNGYDVSIAPEDGSERTAVISQNLGFHIRHPPKPHLLSSPITQDKDLFQAIHMGAVDVDLKRWQLVVDGLVARPFALTFEQLLKLPSSSVQAVHECFGSPLVPARNALWRVGNVLWTGIMLRTLLDLAEPLPSADFVWSEGLDSGTFAGVGADRYQKDLPLSKARSSEVLIAYGMNGDLLNRERGGPVRLIVPGWFGTNSTKWLCRLSLRESRAPGPYTMRFYSTEDLEDPEQRLKPVWEVDVNSMIVRPAPDTVVSDPKIEIEGWAWCHDGIARVDVSFSDGRDWLEADLAPRVDLRWQKFSLQLFLDPGKHTLLARATSHSGKSQALNGRRNYAHKVNIEIDI